MLYKLISFNMCHGDNNNGIIDIKNQASVLKKYNPDIVLLQEVDICTERSLYINELSEFKKYIGLDYSCHGANIPYKSGWYGNAIISRYPIMTSENYLCNFAGYSKEPKGMLHATINIDGKHIEVFNTHFPVYEEERIKFAESILNMFSINNFLEDKILAGDFNFGVIPLGNHRYEFNKKDSYDEYEKILKVFKDPKFEENTWPTGNPIADIDKVFYSGSIKLLTIEKIDVDISDHYPIYAEFEI
jgi:endonuclease/exonuclease/phosphatase family metal-dependent hydrolase